MFFTNFLSVTILQLGKSGGILSFLPFVLIFVVMYFFMIRPQQKKAKELENFQKNMEKGDKVITLSGIHGKVYEVFDTDILLEIASNTRIKIMKSSISHAIVEPNVKIEKVGTVS